MHETAVYTAVAKRPRLGGGGGGSIAFADNIFNLVAN